MEKRKGALCTLNDIWGITKLKSLTITVILLNAAAAVFAVSDVESRSRGVFAGVIGIAAMMSVLMPIFVVGSFSMKRGLLFMLPMKSMDIVRSMLLIIDLSYLAMFICDAIVYIIMGKYRMILADLVFMMIMYCMAMVVLYKSSGPGITINSEGTPTLRAFLGIIFGMFGISAIIALRAAVIARGFFGLSTWIMFTIAAGAAVITAVTRGVTWKMFRNKVRLEKVYKKKNKKDPLEESYV